MANCVSCKGKQMNSGRYKGKTICDFPSGMGGYANCNKRYISLDPLSPGCEDDPTHLRSCCDLHTCHTPTPTTTKVNSDNSIWLWIFLTLVILLAIGLVIYFAKL